jgi:predicted amidohydrolase YtcJ
VSPSLLLFNATIYTMDDQNPQAEAVALRDGRIVAVGRADEVREAAGPRAESIDLEGRAVVPGFIDAHVHLLDYALTLERVNLEGVDSLAQAVALVRQRIVSAEPGAWIRGRGWDHNLWGGSFPHKEDLDGIAPRNPVALTRKDGHLVWCNSLALQAAGIGPQTPDPPGGRIQRGADGEPTGILMETARELVYAAIPAPPAQQRLEALRRAFPIAHSLGLTGAHEMGYLEGGEPLSDYQELLARGELGLRVCATIPRKQVNEALALGLHTGFGDEWLRIGGVKIFMDGTLGSQTADMLADFEGQPGNRGVVVTSAAEIREFVRRASGAGLACTVHCIGDAAVRKALDAIAFCHPQSFDYAQDRSAIRHRIEHAQLVHPDDIPRFARLGVIASMQPIHATSDLEIADRYWGARCRAAYAWRSLLDADARLCFGSDCPIETLSPLAGIHAAVTRQRADGTPEDGWYPEQRLTVAEAVQAYTLGAAYASGEESSKGSITVGKLADLVVLSRDIFAIPPQEILETEVVATVLHGKVVYWR